MTESSPSFGANGFPLRVRPPSTKNSRYSLLLSICSMYCKWHSFTMSQKLQEINVWCVMVRVSDSWPRTSQVWLTASKLFTHMCLCHLHAVYLKTRISSNTNAHVCTAHLCNARFIFINFAIAVAAVNSSQWIASPPASCKDHSLPPNFVSGY